MKRRVLFLLVGLILIPLVGGTQETYQWVDEKGTVHFTDDFGKIPEKYQDQVKKREVPTEALPSPKPPEEKPSPRSFAERKDILGRGEDWWRSKAMEWKQKLINAQKGHEAAQVALRAKQKELEDARLKPKSLQRRLQEEIKVLEENVKSHKSQVDEARNMLQHVLPRQAEEYGADPSWVRVE